MIRYKDELWKAASRGKKIVAVRKVRILEAKGLVLIVEDLKEDKKATAPQQTVKLHRQAER